MLQVAYQQRGATHRPFGDNALDDRRSHRVADEGDRSRIVAVIANGLRGNELANRELVDISLDTGLFEAFGQTIHPARKDRTERATEQVGAPPRPCRERPGLRRCDRRGRSGGGIARCSDRTRQRRIQNGRQDAGGKHRPEHNGCNLRRIDHTRSACTVRPTGTPGHGR